MKNLKRLFTVVLVISVVMAFIPLAVAQDVEKVNINKATIEELVQIKGIGQKYAERIVDFRDKNGPFKKIEDIMNVKGIGPKKFELIKDLITV
jgi:competence protein ComEA